MRILNMEKEPETNPKLKEVRLIKNAANVIEKIGEKNKFKVPESAVDDQSLKLLTGLHTNTKQTNVSTQQPHIPTIIEIDNVEKYERDERDKNIYEIAATEKQQKEKATKIYINPSININKFNSLNTPITFSTILSASRLTALSEQLCDYYLSQDKFTAFSGRVMKVTENFVNLALVDEMPQRDHAKQTLVSAEHTGEQPDIRSKRLTTYQEIYETKKPLVIKDIFTLTEKEQNKKAPNQVLILGQAGTGKTTLCDALRYRWAEAKKQNKALWPNQSFAAVFVLRLRKLAYYKPEEATLGYTIYKECLSEQNRKNTTPEVLEQAVDQWNDHGEVLFILDGYDEVATLVKETEETPQGNLIRQLLAQPKLILTSRPHYLSGIKLDRTLENTGFLTKEIDQYIQKYYNALENPDDAKSLIQTLNQHPASKAIMRIPINLEIMCKYWERHYIGKNISINITLTQLYNCLIEDLSERYAEKFAGYNSVNHGPSFIDNACGLLWHFLAVLAFEQMQTDKLIIPGQKLKYLQDQLDIQSKSTEDTNFLHKLIKFGLLKPLDDSAQKDEFKKDYYFIHLTFQEFFAARYIAFKLQQQEQGMINFIQQHKYDPRYEIVWWFAAGLLKENAKTLTFFFNILENEPQDIIELSTNCLLVRCLEECELKLSSQIKNRLLEQFKEWIKISTYTKNQLGLAFINYLVLSPSVFTPLTPQFSTLLLAENEYVRSAAVRALANQTDLPNDILLRLCNLLLHEKEYVRSAAASALANKTDLSHDILLRLCNLLQDKNDYVRNAAARTLANKTDLPTDILLRLCNLLQDKNDYVRYAAVSALANQTDLPTDILLRLWNLLQDEDWNVSSYAASALANQTNLSNDILLRLCNLLLDKQWHVIYAAALALASKTDLPTDILLRLWNLLQDKNDNVRYAAARTLANKTDLPTDILLRLCNLLQDEKDYVRYAAVSILANQTDLPNDILLRLCNLLLDEKDYVRYAAVSALPNKTDLPTDILLRLCNLLLDKQWHVRYAAARALPNKTDLPTDILLRLCNLLLDKQWKVRNAAARALANKTDLPTDILLHLGNLLLNKQWEVRNAAARTLEKKTNLPTDILLRLCNLLLDEKDYVRYAAVSALENQTDLPTDILLHLGNLLLDKQWEVRNAAARALADKTDLPTDILLHLGNLLQDKNEDVRDAAARALENQTDLPTDILLRLCNLLQDKNEDVRDAAARALANKTDLPTDILLHLGNLLLDEKWEVRNAAARALPNKTDLPTDILLRLCNLLLDEKWKVRYAAASILPNKTDLPTDILLRLCNLLQDKNEDVRYAAARALENQTFLPFEVYCQLGKQLLILFPQDSYNLIKATKLLSISLIAKYLFEGQTDIQYFSLLSLLVLKSLNEKVSIYVEEGKHFFVGNKESIPLINLQKNKLLNDLKAVFIWLTNTEEPLVLKERHGTPEIAFSLAKLGAIFYSLDEYDQAKLLFESALPILEHAYGCKHKEVKTARDKLNNINARIFKQQLFDKPSTVDNYSKFGLFPNLSFLSDQEKGKILLGRVIDASKAETNPQLESHSDNDNIDFKLEKTKEHKCCLS